MTAAPPSHLLYSPISLPSEPGAPAWAAVATTRTAKQVPQGGPRVVGEVGLAGSRAEEAEGLGRGPALTGTLETCVLGGRVAP